MEKSDCLNIRIIPQQIKEQGKILFETSFSEADKNDLTDSMDIRVFIDATINSTIDEINKKGMLSIKNFVSKVQSFL